MSPDSVSARETSVHLAPTAGWDGQLPPEELPGAWEPFLALRPERLASDQDCFVRPETFAAVGSELRAWDQGAQRGLDSSTSARGTSLPFRGSRQPLEAQPLQHVPPRRRSLRGFSIYPAPQSWAWTLPQDNKLLAPLRLPDF